MLLTVRISSYGCTWEVWRALKKLGLLEVQLLRIFLALQKIKEGNNRNEEEVEEEEGIKTLRKENNKNEEEVEEQEEDSIKTWRRENNKIVEEGIKELRRGKMWWWLHIFPIHQAVLKKS